MTSVLSNLHLKLAKIPHPQENEEVLIHGHRTPETNPPPPKESDTNLAHVVVLVSLQKLPIEH